MKNKDEKLYNSLSRLSLSIPGDSLNIYFTYKKNKKGCFIDITENVSKKLEYILDKYNLLYKKYDRWGDGILLYFISNITNPKNIDFFDSKNKINHIKIGKFLGYGCIHNLDKDKPCQKGYRFGIYYNDYKNPSIQVYAFCCLKLNINIINQTLKIVNEMNYNIEKYLFKKLKGNIELSIINRNIR
jgi:hypothetical protein